AEETAALLDSDAARRRDVLARVRGWLTETKATVRGVSSELHKGPLHQVLVIDGLRADVEWLSGVLARLGKETPHPLSAWLEVELDRLRETLRRSSGVPADPLDEPIRIGSERLTAVVLVRRIRRELANPLSGCCAEELWTERFHLSRLQAQ